MMSAFYNYPKVVCLGDSITQYGYNHDGQWVALLADFLQRRCDVINRGYSGYNSRWLRILLPQLLQKGDDIALLIIFTGANDAADVTLNRQQHVPLDEYGKNLEEMINYAKSIGIPPSRVILVGPPPLNEAEWKKHAEMKGKCLSLFNKSTRTYADLCYQVASSNGVDVIPLFDLIQQDDPENWQRHLFDGLHLSASGSRLLFEALKPVVTTKVEHIPTLISPHWSEVDVENPEKSLVLTAIQLPIQTDN